MMGDGTTRKYPRTPHLPWSPGASADDRVMADAGHLFAGEVVVTEKLDGENCTMHRGGLYARSVDSVGGMLRQRARALWASIGHDIPEGMLLCGENMQWEHSIRYEDLTSPFYVFSVWDGDTCLSWDDTLGVCEMLGLPTVPVLYRGQQPGHAAVLAGAIPPLREDQEGYVVRRAGQFDRRSFHRSVAKFVRAGHVRTGEHWTRTLRENGFR
jgi:hypothetical protein